MDLRSQLALLARRLIPTGIAAQLSPHCALGRHVDSTVLTGPFAGTALPVTAPGSTYLPKLFGIYESELHPAIAAIIASQPSTIIDVGAAEGYYHCGLGRLLPAATLISYETTESGRTALATNAAANGLTARSNIRGTCTPETLAADLGSYPEACLIIDAEGAEHQLLCAAMASLLARATILVELHPWVHPDLDRDVRAALSNHSIQEIHTNPRTLADIPTPIPPFIRHFRAETVLRLLTEGRPVPMTWLFATPNQSP